MTTFTGGPAEGHILMLRRAPQYLRVVVAPGNKVDALDQLDDTPAAEERIHVYELQEFRGSVHITRSPRSQSGNYVAATYRHLEPQPAESEVRETEAWRDWTRRAAAARTEP